MPHLSSNFSRESYDILRNMYILMRKLDNMV